MTEANVVSQPVDSAPAYALSGANGVVSLDPSPRIAQWQKLQFGLFLHWGVYSIYEGSFDGTPQGIGYPEQIKAWMNIPDNHYLQAAQEWKAADWDASQICRIAKDAGMSYVMITTKHHDGFCMWDTHTTDFNIVKRSAFGRDPLAELAHACAAHGLKLAFYFSIIDWTQHEAEPYANLNAIPEEMMPYVEAQIEELLTNYGPIAEFWFDMGGPTPAQSQRLAATVRRCQPDTTVMNSRVWNDCGDFEVGGDNDIPPFFQYGPWESVRSIFPAAWSYCTTDKCDRSTDTIPEQVHAAITDLIDVITGGGQFAYNLGPMPSGAFDPYDLEVMDGISQWMHRHPTAIKGARPTWIPIPDWGRISTHDDRLFLFPHSWIDGAELRIPGVTNAVLSTQIDGTAQPLPLRREGADLIVTLTGTCPDPVRPVIQLHLDGPVQVANPHTVILDLPSSESTKDPLFSRLYLDKSSAELPKAVAHFSSDSLVAHRTAKGYSGGFAAIDAYIANSSATPLQDLTLVFELNQNQTAPSGSFYRLSCGDNEGFISAESLETGIIQTNWTLPAHSVHRIRIEYASVPNVYTPYYADSLDFDLSTLEIYAWDAPGHHIIEDSTSLLHAHQLAEEAQKVCDLLTKKKKNSPEQPLPTVSPIQVETVMGEEMTTSGDGSNRIVTIATGTVLGCQVQVEGDPYPSIQWQVLPHGAQAWEDLPNQHAPTWTRVSDESLHRAKIRVKVTNTAGTATSGMITIHLT